MQRLDNRTATMSAKLGRIGAVLIDLSGTMHIENNVIPGAVEALQRLRNTRIPLKFVTNTTKDCKRVLYEQLNRLGFDIRLDEMFTSLTAARLLVEERKLRPLLLLQDSALEDFEGISTDNPNSVVVGLAPDYFNYDVINKVFRLVLEGSTLIAVHKARYYKRNDGMALGPGPFVEAIEYATESKAVVVGKPKKGFFLSALKGMECKPQNAVMIGDDVRDDVGGAQQAGMQGILVKTGKYRENDEMKIDPPPTVTCDDFPSAVELIIQSLEEVVS
ncbi:haloacid dehalogenase-like hydrolase domain-containing protein 2 [Saccoglossus kowalevskii]|uniref:Haloacid dehalogenase-like hydrolase domain-containing protein 2 n=1 Tax=Saccoglossus kowalevskii TaxID=10224 RepID=A0ABM0GXV4_SACKO|nr:PREDICTED: haloacid dehalogenase-like hydrolase domain-containing protein 2-like [Saccoglossus kowalevskii]